MKNIAVLGAGPMGLAVAYQLAKDGYNPIIFEADDRVGGMTATFDFNGLTIERYYHFHCTSDVAFLEILSELGISDKLHWQKTKMGYWYQNQLQSWGNPIALLSFKGLGFLAKIRYGLHAFLSTKQNNWHTLDKLEATEWIKGWVGQDAYRVLWQKLFDYKFYNYAHSLSAAWIWSRIRRIGRSRYNIFQEKLGYLAGGSDTLLQAMKTYIEQHNGVFQLKSPIKKVIIENNSVVGLEVNGQIQKFDKIISTIPIPYIPNIIPDLPNNILEKYKSIKNIAVVCVIIKLKKSVTPNFWLNVNDERMDIPGLVEYTNLYPLKNHIVYIPFYMPFEHKKFSEPNENFILKVKSYLQEINPSLQDSDFLDIYVNRYKHAQPICEPNFLSMLPPVALPISGLWVADTSYYYPEDRGISESIQFGRNLAKLVTQS